MMARVFLHGFFSKSYNLHWQYRLIWTLALNNYSVLVIFLLDSWILHIMHLLSILYSIPEAQDRTLAKKGETTIVAKTSSQFSHPFGLYIIHRTIWPWYSGSIPLIYLLQASLFSLQKQAPPLNLIPNLTKVVAKK